MFVREWVSGPPGPRSCLCLVRTTASLGRPWRDGRCSNPPGDGNSNERRENETNSAYPGRRDDADEENC